MKQQPLLEEIGADAPIACETIANETFGDALRATVGGPSNSAIMLMGHRDTVFPKGEPTRRPFKIENGKAYGPGVADMKAGLVMNAFVLAAFHACGGHGGPPKRGRAPFRYQKDCHVQRI